MSLAVGTRIGVYQVEAALGAGGMGEVYRARDTRLGRAVAIKVLPLALTHDRDRLTRMEREARVLAALNHPNIGALYGVEEIDGAWALVLELIEGETLATRLARAVSVPEALALARQIAAALDAAHEKGIVHRDLKPGNVMVTPAGAVKVLDFGLAKLWRPEGDVDLSHAATETGVTERGAVLGTPAYMSPEQARGQAVDKRADIWAFGCVLYELLARRRAFRGGSVPEVLAAILEHEPDWAALPTNTPQRVREVLRRCLTKDVTRRARDIGDVALDLDAVSADSGAGADLDHTRRPGVGWQVAAVAVTLVAIGEALLLWQRSASSPPVASVATVGALTRLTSDQGLSTQPSLSADGRLLAYASNRGGASNLDIYVQQATGGTAIRLTDDLGDDHQPSMSPDGSLVVFRSERTPRGIYVASALGGAARLLAPDGLGPAFSPDGRSIAFWTGRWLAPRGVDALRQAFVMPASGGSPTRVATNLESAGDPVWAPDGRHLLLFGRESSSGGNTEPDWWWQPVEGGAAVATGVLTRLAASGAAGPVDLVFPYPLVWTKAGVVFTGDRGSDGGDAQPLWLIAVDPASGRVAGDGVRLTNGTTQDVWASVALNGRMVFAALTSHRTPFLLPLEANAGKATGAFRHVRDDGINTGRTSVSQDGRLMVLPRYEFDAGGLWVRDLLSGQERQLAATPRTPLNPVMSADGQMVAYTITKVVTGGDAGFGDGMVVPTSGGVPRKVCESCQAYAWTSDTRQVVVTVGGSRALVRIDVTSGEQKPLLSLSSGGLPMFGPDDRWVIFNSSRSVFVAPVYADRATPESEWSSLFAPTVGGERSTGLSPDGALLYLLLERDGFRCLYAMRLDPATGRSRGEPFVVAHVHDATRQWGSTGYGSAVVRGLFVANLFETSGNLWMTTLGTGR